MLPSILLTPSTPSSTGQGDFPPGELCRALTFAGFAIGGQLVAGVALAAGAAAVAVAAVHAAPVPVGARVPHCRQSTEPGSPHAHPAPRGTAGEQSTAQQESLQAVKACSAPGRKSLLQPFGRISTL